MKIIAVTGSVNGIDHFLSLTAATHLDETEPERLAGDLIRNNGGRFNGAMHLEYFPQLSFGHRIWQTADIELTTHVLLLKKTVNAFNPKN